jgi:hypothetical protein
MENTVSTDNANSESVGRKAGLCLAWLTLFGLIGWLVLTAAMPVIQTRCSREELPKSRALMTQQMEQLKRGEINCLVQPDPRFIDELLAGPVCTANIRDLYLGCDVSDQRLARLRELPNLKCIVFLFAENPDIFLERLRGNATIEELTFDHSFVPSRAIEAIASLPNLKSLALPLDRPKAGKLHGLKNHPTIEKLYLRVADLDESLIPVLQTLPSLRRVTIDTTRSSTDAKSYEGSLRKALPNCECHVANVGG